MGNRARTPDKRIQPRENRCFSRGIERGEIARQRVAVGRFYETPAADWRIAFTGLDEAQALGAVSALEEVWVYQGALRTT